MLCQLFATIKQASALSYNPESHHEEKKRTAKRQGCPYISTRLHRVSQITDEVSGLVLRVIAAGQLGQALINKRTDWSNHSKGKL